VEGREGRAVGGQPLPPLYGRGGVPLCPAVWKVLSALLGPQFGWLEVETDALEVGKDSFPYPLPKGLKELVDLSSF